MTETPVLVCSIPFRVQILEGACSAQFFDWEYDIEFSIRVKIFERMRHLAQMTTEYRWEFFLVNSNLRKVGER
jgi:hypothetical protein